MSNPAKSRKRDLSGLWVAVESWVMDYSQVHADPYEEGFRMARALHGVSAMADIDPHTLSSASVARHVEAARDDHRIPVHDDCIEQMAATWHKVAIPDGWHAVEYAVKRLSWKPHPQKAKGKYATTRQALLSTQLWHIFASLPKDEHGHVFASVRTLSAYTSKDKETVALALHALEKAQLLQRESTGNKTYADRFSVLQFPYR